MRFIFCGFHNPDRGGFFSCLCVLNIVVLNYIHKDWEIKKVRKEEKRIVMEVESIKESAICPVCGSSSSRVHSTYTRAIHDLPILNYTVLLSVKVRKFFCENARCLRKIFAENLDGLAGRYSRRTYRLKETLLQLAMVVSAEAVSKMPSHMSNGVCPNTLIRLVRNSKSSNIDIKSVKHIGIDDWAFKKRKTYGTLICDLETRKPIDILPNRDSETLSNWLKEHPHISIVCRDRSSIYAGAVSKALPGAVQVVDRWHLLKNIFDAMLRYVKANYPKGLIIKENHHDDVVFEETPQENKTKYDLERAKSLERKNQRILKVKQLFSEGYNKSQISRMTGLSRPTVQFYIQMEGLLSKQKRKRENLATPYMDTIIKLVSEGLKPKIIFNRIVSEGYEGSERFLKYVIDKHITVKKTQAQTNKHKIDGKQISMILWKKEESFTDNQKKYHEKVSQYEGDLIVLRRLIQQFRTAIEKRDETLLVDWLKQVRTNKNQCFYEVVEGMKTDIEAIKNSVKYSYSNGLLEGNINRLKAIKRQMYGRAKIDLLKKKVLHCL